MRILELAALVLVLSFSAEAFGESVSAKSTGKSQTTARTCEAIQACWEHTPSVPHTLTLRNVSVNAIVILDLWKTQGTTPSCVDFIIKPAYETGDHEVHLHETDPRVGVETLGRFKARSNRVEVIADCN